ncbi:hypothetical protein WDU94_011875 [Cyamophila willieti]
MSKAFDSDNESEYYLLKRKDTHTADTLPVSQSKRSSSFNSSQHVSRPLTPNSSPQGGGARKSDENSREPIENVTKLKYSVGFELNNLSVKGDEEDNTSWGSDDSPPHTFYRRLSQIRPPVDVAASLVAARKSALEKSSLKNSSPNSVIKSSSRSVEKANKVVKFSRQNSLRSSSGSKRFGWRSSNGNNEPVSALRNGSSPSQCRDLKIPPSLENFRHVSSSNPHEQIVRYSYGTEVYSSPSKKPPEYSDSSRKNPDKPPPARYYFPGKTSSLNLNKVYTDDLSNLYNQTHNIPKVSLRKNSGKPMVGGQKESFVFFRPSIFPKTEDVPAVKAANPSSSVLRITSNLNKRALSPSPLQKPVYQPMAYDLFRKNSNSVNVKHHFSDFGSNGRHTLDLPVNKSINTGGNT